MDFAAARATASSLLPALPHHREDPLRRLCLVVVGAAEAGLGNFEEALQYLLTARREMDEQLVIVDWYHRLMLQWALTNLWIDRGALARAREEGALFIEHAAATVEQSWRALAWEANARIALASGDVQGASDLVDQAVDAVNGVEAPVAAWQVHATAAVVADARDDAATAAHHREKSRQIIIELSESLGPNEALRRTFLGAPAVRRALGESVSAPRFSVESVLHLNRSMQQ
jgi:tetratricopeptide (TPR) repeat protein